MTQQFSTTSFLSLDEVFQTHLRQLALHGGKQGTNQFRLHAATFAAFRLAESGEIPYDDLFTLAAIYSIEIIRERPFAEGNVRTAGVVAHQFLFVNGFQLTASEDQFFDMIVNLGLDSQAVAELAAFYEVNSEPTPVKAG